MLLTKRKILKLTILIYRYRHVRYVYVYIKHKNMIDRKDRIQK